MSAVRIERDALLIHDNVVLDNYPISVYGAALFIRNDSDADVTLTLAESDDGTAYSLVLMNTIDATGVSSVSIKAASREFVQFATAKRYLRIARAAAGPVIACHLVQWTPANRADVQSY